VAASQLTLLTFLKVPAEGSLDTRVVAVELFMWAHWALILDSVALETKLYEGDNLSLSSLHQAASPTDLSTGADSISLSLETTRPSWECDTSDEQPAFLVTR
jgi:hypothetical protein